MRININYSENEQSKNRKCQDFYKFVKEAGIGLYLIDRPLEPLLPLEKKSFSPAKHTIRFNRGI